MKLFLYQNNRLINSIEDLYFKDNIYHFNDQGIDNEIVVRNNLLFNRKNKEFEFSLKIADINEAKYILIEQDLVLDIKVIKADYIDNESSLIINYQLETDDSAFKIIIEKEE